MTSTGPANLNRTKTVHATPDDTREVRDPRRRIIWSGHPVRDKGWQEHAVCLGDPETGDSLYVETVQLAAQNADQVCPGCPARFACLEYGLARGEQHGVWGGLPAKSDLFKQLVQERLDELDTTPNTGNTPADTATSADTGAAPPLEEAA